MPAPARKTARRPHTARRKFVYLFEEVHLAERASGSLRRPARPARRQGREPGGDDAARAAGAAGLHRHHRSLQRLPRRRRQVPGGPVGAGAGRARAARSRPPARSFGDPANPLLVSCRSGAKFSMPGMMDTVLNIGLNDERRRGHGRAHRRRALRLRRLPPPGADVRHGRAGRARRAVRGGAGAAPQARAASTNDAELPADGPAARSPASSRRSCGSARARLPGATRCEQLRLATEAVFDSWNGKRAVDYRNAAGIAHDLGTAVNIVTWSSATWARTRAPASR